ncbi:DNA-binding protein [Periconia macrospinosa]|uniref:DNA-binding protein n=1 Tax=Periconia macrospinosa TaxID=97972 RepID=A0A2V1EDH1_9PLEO|nr:DNA-binding protein [Periconia macrospinosa]
MPSTTYISTINAFTRFLAAYTHTVLYLRTLYPRTSFVRARFHNTPVHQSRHPLVCEWIRDAITAVRDQLLSGTVARIAIVIYHYDPATKGTGSPTIMERHIVDVSTFPVVEKDARNAVMEWRAPSPTTLQSDEEEDEDENQDENQDEDEDEDEDDDNDQDHEDSDEKTQGGNDGNDNGGNGNGDHESNQEADEHQSDADGKSEDIYDHSLLVDLAEQFRSALVTLTTRCGQLGPLPPKCSFNFSIELKDEAHVHPPLAHPQAWIPVAPGAQNTGSETITDAGRAAKNVEGSRRAAAKVTPIRTVEAGVFRFETWIEEGKAKFNLINGHSVPTLAT